MKLSIFDCDKFHTNFPATQFHSCSVLRIVLLITNKYTVSAVFTVMRCLGLTFICGITIHITLHNNSRHTKRQNIPLCKTTKSGYSLRITEYPDENYNCINSINSIYSNTYTHIHKSSSSYISKNKLD
jgi:hypothetical protein